MNSDDEAFANCIEENYSDSDSDKENFTRTKPEQIAKNMSFVQDDEAFANCIEENHSDSDSDKENLTRTKPEQIAKIMSFVGENTGQTDKKVYSSLWDLLSKELNDIGPPKHTAKRWKRIWTVYKYNNKKRLPEMFHNQSQQHQGDQTRDHLVLLKNHTEQMTKNSTESKSEMVDESSFKSCAETVTPNHPTDHSARPEIITAEMLSLVLSQQTTIIQKLDKHESLLEEIIKKI